jgi:DHA2 family multidrug resistance protein-like MFS transporter
VQKKSEAGTQVVPDGLPAPERYWAMAAILMGIALSVLDSTLVNLALPDITRDFGASPAAAVWVVNAYQLATLTLLLPCAKLGGRVGYRRVYLVGLSVFTVASLACVVAPSLGLLSGARAVQGLGAAGMMAVNAALVRLTYPSQMLGRGLALNSVVVATSRWPGRRSPPWCCRSPPGPGCSPSSCRSGWRCGGSPGVRCRAIPPRPAVRACSRWKSR